MRLAIPILGPSDADIESQLEQAAQLTDLVELRLDLFHQLHPSSWHFPGERIFTVRSADQLDSVQNADYLDLEDPRLDPGGVRLILSRHNHTAADFDFKTDRSAYLYKLACRSDSTLDALRLAVATRNLPHPAIGIAMGASCSRLLAPLVGSPWTYAALDRDHRCAPGQLTVEEMRPYRLTEKGPSTRLYGLIGDPLDKSQGYRHHNRAFGPEALYINFPMRPEELEEGLSLLQQLGLAGLSVTMPLKEVIVPRLDQLETRSGAVNTVAIRDQERIGTNTDGSAVLDAIEERLKVEGRHLVILGAGGAARAIAFEAAERGARLTILNRTLPRAEALAQEVGATASTLSDVPKCDILVQATSLGMRDSQLAPTGGAPQVVLDVVNQPTTPWLEQFPDAIQISGLEMWERQAAAQRRFWGMP